MGLSEVQMQRMARNVVDMLEQNNAAKFLSAKETVVSKVSEIIKNNFNLEKELDREVNVLVDQLIANSNDKALDRHKMFKMAKERLAKQKGFVL